MSKDDRIDEIEKAKYQKVWEHDAYRNWSPGGEEHEMARDRFMRELSYNDEITPSIRDYGCGEGWTVQYFSDHGWLASGVEHAPNAIKAAGILVHEECLWDMGHLNDTDFAFCADVMEHIPPMKVSAVLAQIAKLTKQAAIFRIAFHDDNFGPQILGQPLHLTVKDGKWWQKELSKHWCVVEGIKVRRTYGTFICRAPKHAVLKVE